MSERELEVVELLVQGASNREIAAGLHISPNTVKVHLRNVYTKLGVASRTECATVVVQQGLISLPGVIVEEEEPEPEGEAVNGSEAAAQAETADDEESEQERTSSPPWWQYGALGLTLLAVVGLLIVAGNQVLGSSAVTPTLESESNPSVPLANDWFRTSALPQPRAGLATATVGLTIYAIGGDDGAVVFDDVYTFDTNLSQWRSAAPKPTAITDATAAVLFGEIYVPGGQGADGSPTAAVEVYSPANDAWRAVADLPQPLSGALALSDGSFIYVFGGWNGEEYVDEAYVYDPTTDGWRPLTTLPRPLADAAGGAMAGELYVVGGFDGEADLDQCHRFDTVTEVWRSCPPMLEARGGAAAVTLFNRLYVLGGGLDNASATYGEMFNPANDTWQVINVPSEVQQTAWTDLGLSVVERLVYATGGREDEVARDANLIYVPLPFRTFIPSVSEP